MNIEFNISKSKLPLSEMCVDAIGRKEWFALTNDRGAMVLFYIPGMRAFTFNLRRSYVPSTIKFGSMDQVKALISFSLLTRDHFISERDLVVSGALQKLLSNGKTSL